MESYPGGAGTDAPDLNDEFKNIISREFGVGPDQSQGGEHLPFGPDFMREVSDVPPSINDLGSNKTCATVKGNGAIDNGFDGTD